MDKSLHRMRTVFGVRRRFEQDDDAAIGQNGDVARAILLVVQRRYGATDVELIEKERVNSTISPKKFPRETLTTH